MNIELINTGTELMLGRILNTHQQWLCRQLSDLGYIVDRQVAVPDTGPEIRAAVRDALTRATLVITTGGLGPTSDDRTRDLVAELLGRRLLLNETVREEIRQFFQRRKRPQPASTDVQAMVPEGATVVPNAFGTAPGLILEVPAGRFRPATASSWLIMLPGPTRELRPMFTDQIVPWLRRRLPLERTFVSRTLRTMGIGESLVEERIAPLLAELVTAGLEIGYCAATGEVDVRLSAGGPDAERAVAAAESIVREKVGDFVYGTGDELMENILVRMLTERRQTLALAESCTGGLLGNRITNVPGASAVLLGGFITYSNDAKRQLLRVPKELLDAHGAVSEPVAQAMAAGAREALGADYALSVTGVAGPGGGSEAKPVGTVFVGLATRQETIVTKFYNPYDRATFKHVTSQQALDLLRRKLITSA